MSEEPSSPPTTATLPQAKRGPRRCKICPDRPLKAVCGCFNGGRKRKICSIPEMSQTTSEQLETIDPVLSEQNAALSPSIVKPQGQRRTSAERVSEWGTVEGVKRGNLPYIIPRYTELRPLIEDANTSNTRFNREMAIIISRTERASIETDCYMLIMAQQATGSSATIHFASPRLRREGLQETADLINQFQTLMTNLVLAKRNETLALAKQLQKAQEKAKEANQAAELSQEQLASTTAQLLDREAYILRLEEELSRLCN
ncbi:hypothetical protein NP233_g9830 [Leucocoprinus birnbaumii]|uniref:Uncharacterized protein n=1 Tax=Leucocoprinus birnbaumii TaxID=56174 RepID=A0AAD5VK48_9AGAR|nr:hypothetical protein NP233_g9830 [Leucocoprinus birnbaumii]